MLLIRISPFLVRLNISSCVYWLYVEGFVWNAWSYILWNFLLDVYLFLLINWFISKISLYIIINWCQSFVGYMCGKYVLSVCIFYFCCIDGIFWGTKVLNVKEFSTFSFKISIVSGNEKGVIMCIRYWYFLCSGPFAGNSWALLWKTLIFRSVQSTFLRIFMTWRDKIG